MVETRTEEETAEALREWLRRNGPYLVAGVVLGLALLFGWRVYDQHRQEQAEQASAHYAELINAAQQNERDQARSLGERLTDEYPSTSYAPLGALALAKLALEEGDFEAAASQLRWAMEHAGDDQVAALARLRLARVLLQDGEPGQALELVAESPVETYRTAYAELRGDIHADAGRTEEARRAYTEALGAARPDAEDVDTLRMKLDNLGGPLS